MSFEGTVSFEPLGTWHAYSVTGSGVATVNAAGVDAALHTLTLAGGVSGTAVVPVTDPEITATIASIQLQATLGSGVLRPFSTSPALTQNILPLVGSARICLVVAGCSSYQQIFPFDDGAAGIGVGGVWSGGSGANRVSVQGAPWTVGTALLSVGTFSIPEFGGVHGPLSIAGSTALPGGEVQLVTPVLVTSGVEPSLLTGFVRTRLRFIPEPTTASLVVTGALTLVLIGRHRMQSRRTR